MNDASKNLLHAVESGNKDKIKNALEKLDQVQIADFLLTAKTEERDLIVKEYLQDYPEVLLYLNNDIILAILELLDIEEFAHIIQKLQPEDAVDILEDLDLLQVERLLEFFPKNLGLVIKEILSYPEESAGRLIHKDFIVVPKNWTAEQLLQFIRMQKKLPKYLNEIFVINDRNQPIGSVTLKNVVRAKTRSKIQDVMDPNIKIIKAGQDQEEVAQLFKDYSLNCAAVVDDISQIIGVISIDDVVDVIEEKAEEDILHVGRVSESDINAGIGQTVLRRVKWLIITFFSINCSSYIIGFFGNILQKNIELAILMPVVAAMGGNAGIQASTIAVRAIVTKQLTGINAFRLFAKEACVGCFNGLIMSGLIVIVIFLRFHSIMLEATFVIVIMAVFTLSTSVGAAIPFLVERFGGDPALSSSIITSSFTDLLAFFVLLSVASLMLSA